MEIIFKILAIALITSIASLIVRPVRNDFAVMIALTGGVVILVLVLSYLTGIFDTIKNVIDNWRVFWVIFTYSKNCWNWLFGGIHRRRLF